VFHDRQYFVKMKKVIAEINLKKLLYNLLTINSIEINKIKQPHD